MRRAAVGGQELEVLKWVAEHAPVSVAEVAEAFGQSHGHARTTVLTVLERLRGKGYLVREKGGGVFRYAPSEPHETQMRGLVGRFVEQSLSGSLDPFVAYLAQDARLSHRQLEQLKQLVRELESRENGAGEAGNNAQHPAPDKAGKEAS